MGWLFKISLWSEIKVFLCLENIKVLGNYRMYIKIFGLQNVRLLIKYFVRNIWNVSRLYFSDTTIDKSIIRWVGIQLWKIWTKAILLVIDYRVTKVDRGLNSEFIKFCSEIENGFEK